MRLQRIAPVNNQMWLNYIAERELGLERSYRSPPPESTRAAVGPTYDDRCAAGPRIPVGRPVRTAHVPPLAPVPSVSTLAWIVVLGVTMSAIAMVGSVTLFVSQENLDRMVVPLVALAAGSLLGGAFLHMMPNAIESLGNGQDVWLSFLVGFAAFFVLEQCLHWHHCHRVRSEHRPIGHLILIADGLHNFLGGLSVASAFFIDHRTGLIAWAAAAAHEIPQELGDFGILVSSGWSRRSALAYNVASASTFLIGGIVAYALAGAVDVVYLVPFAAGNFAYIGATDLLPELTTDTALAGKLLGGLGFAAGLGLLWAAATFL